MADHGTPFRRVGELDTLLDFLDYLRDCLVHKVEDLDTDVASAPGVASGTSLLGLVKHLAWVEGFWFVDCLQGLDNPVDDEGLEPGDTVASVVASYRAAAARSDEAVRRSGDLGQLLLRPGVAPEPMTLRWVLVHMVEETARHAGHADILREQYDGTTGR
jgi:uncharacterized damage-inducible protein DinB